MPCSCPLNRKQLLEHGVQKHQFCKDGEMPDMRFTESRAARKQADAIARATRACCSANCQCRRDGGKCTKACWCDGELAKCQLDSGSASARADEDDPASGDSATKSWMRNEANGQRRALTRGLRGEGKAEGAQPQGDVYPREPPSHAMAKRRIAITGILSEGIESREVEDERGALTGRKDGGALGQEVAIDLKDMLGLGLRKEMADGTLSHRLGMGPPMEGGSCCSVAATRRRKALMRQNGIEGAPSGEVDVGNGAVGEECAGGGFRTCQEASEAQGKSGEEEGGEEWDEQGGGEQGGQGEEDGRGCEEGGEGGGEWEQQAQGGQHAAAMPICVGGCWRELVNGALGNKDASGALAGGGDGTQRRKDVGGVLLGGKASRARLKIGEGCGAANGGLAVGALEPQLLRGGALSEEKEAVWALQQREDLVNGRARRPREGMADGASGQLVAGSGPFRKPRTSRALKQGEAGGASSDVEARKKLESEERGGGASGVSERRVGNGAGEQEGEPTAGKPRQRQQPRQRRQQLQGEGEEGADGSNPAGEEVSAATALASTRLKQALASSNAEAPPAASRHRVVPGSTRVRKPRRTVTDDKETPALSALEAATTRLDARPMKLDAAALDAASSKLKSASPPSSHALDHLSPSSKSQPSPTLSKQGSGDNTSGQAHAQRRRLECCSSLSVPLPLDGDCQVAPSVPEPSPPLNVPASDRMAAPSELEHAAVPVTPGQSIGPIKALERNDLSRKALEREAHSNKFEPTPFCLEQTWAPNAATHLMSKLDQTPLSKLDQTPLSKLEQMRRHLSAGHLRVASFNVHMLLTENSNKLHNIASCIIECDADIIALQELTKGAALALKEKLVILTALEWECLECGDVKEPGRGEYAGYLWRTGRRFRSRTAFFQAPQSEEMGETLLWVHEPSGGVDCRQLIQTRSQTGTAPRPTQLSPDATRYAFCVEVVLGRRANAGRAFNERCPAMVEGGSRSTPARGDASAAEPTSLSGAVPAAGESCHGGNGSKDGVDNIDERGTRGPSGGGFQTLFLMNCHFPSIMSESTLMTLTRALIQDDARLCVVSALKQQMAAEEHCPSFMICGDFNWERAPPCLQKSNLPTVFEACGWRNAVPLTERTNGKEFKRAKHYDNFLVEESDYWRLRSRDGNGGGAKKFAMWSYPQDCQGDRRCANFTDHLCITVDITLANLNLEE